MKKVLSIFIDESGDFGAFEPHSPYYLVAMTLHDQSVDISENINGLELHLRNLNFDCGAIHTAPIIRREEIYRGMLIEDRKRIFNALFNFARKLDFRYIYTYVDKSKCDDIIDIISRISKNISGLILTNKDYFDSFDDIIVYYDNGQIELTKIITSVFHAFFANVEFRKVQPADYKLFQVSDLLCTVELSNLKIDANRFSNSESEFFGSPKNFKKNYYKSLLKKRL